MKKLVTIASYLDASLAEAIRGQLEAYGIRAIVVDSVTSHMLAHVGNAIGGAKIQVSAEQAEDAARIIEELASDERDANDVWRCLPCQEIVDGHFEICWSCRRLRAEVEDPSFSVETAEAVVTSGDTDTLTSSFDRNQLPDVTDDNPYASPWMPTVTPAEKRRGTDGSGDSKSAEDYVTRAYRTSLISVLILPPLLNFVSLYFLLRAKKTNVLMSSSTRRKFQATLAINVLVLLMVGCVRYLSMFY